MDIISYILGMVAGGGVVTIEGTDYTFTDDGEGNVTMEVSD